MWEIREVKNGYIVTEMPTTPGGYLSTQHVFTSSKSLGDWFASKPDPEEKVGC